jgi:glycosyltransferase involved in cell wall biosynthesis
VSTGRPYPIVFLLTSFDVGGTERQMVELIRRLDRSTFDVHVACFHRRGALEPLATSNAASVATFPIDGFHRPSAVLQLLSFVRWCRLVGARIVHTCELYANIFGLPGAAMAGVDVRIGNRRELVTPDKTRAQLAAQRFAYRSAHAVVANSHAAAAQLRREGIDEHKIRTIANGVDTAAFAADRSTPSSARIVMVANLRQEKGHDTLIAAAPIVARRYPDVEFLIVGDGPLRASLVRQVNLRGLRARFQFLGERDDVPSILSSSGIFVLPSRTEASPNGVLEAMAAALPTIASRVGGIPELIDHGATGILVEPDSPDALAAAILDLLDRPAFATALGRAARAQVEQRFSFDRMVANFEQLYLSKLDHHEAGAERAAS